ncbi:MAG: hypothetical protein ACK5MR_10200 [Cumulibacter sp.]
MGMSIEETPIPFDIDRQLTPEEMGEISNYCKYDVLGTETLFEKRMDYFNTKSSIIRLGRLSKNNLGETNAKLTSKVLKAFKKDTFNDTNNFLMPSNLRLGKYEGLLSLFENGIPESTIDGIIGGLPVSYGLGGLHGAIKGFSGTENDLGHKYAIIDFESFYPALMITQGLMSRNATDKKLFTELFEKRKEVMKTNPIVGKAYKQVLVSTYGSMEYRFNNLYDPCHRRNIAVSGQLFLTDLVDKLEDIVELIQVNTDGIIVKIADNNIQEVYKRLEGFKRRTGLSTTID